MVINIRFASCGGNHHDAARAPHNIVMPKYVLSPVPFSTHHHHHHKECDSHPSPTPCTTPKIDDYGAILTAIAARNQALYLRCLLRLESAQRDAQLQPPYPVLQPLESPPPTPPLPIRRTQSSPEFRHAEESSDDESLSV